MIEEERIPQWCDDHDHSIPDVAGRSLYDLDYKHRRKKPTRKHLLVVAIYARSDGTSVS
jgi:hypothetical protein